MASIAQNGSLYRFDFMVFDVDGVTPKTGLVNANFAKKLSFNGANSGLSVTVTEVDAVNFAGLYEATYTPNANGYYFAKVSHATYAVRGVIDDAFATTGGPGVSSLNANALDATNLTAAAGSKIADIVWRRTYANVRASANGDAVGPFQSALGLLALLVNKRKISGASMIVYHEDGVSVFETAGLVSTPGANPVTEIDPT